MRRHKADIKGNTCKRFSDHQTEVFIVKRYFFILPIKALLPAIFYSEYEFSDFKVTETDELHFLLNLASLMLTLLIIHALTGFVR